MLTSVYELTLQAVANDKQISQKFDFGERINKSQQPCESQGRRQLDIQNWKVGLLICYPPSSLKGQY